MIIQSTRVWIDESFKKAAIEIRDGKITGIYPHDSREGAIDYGNNRILPGLIDVHCHGYHGMTCNEVTKEGMKLWAHDLLQEGCTSFEATTSTAAMEDLDRSFGILADIMDEGTDGAEILGIHVEGPLISAEFRGAQEISQLVKPTVEVMTKWQTLARGKINYVAIAPEMDDEHQTIKWCKENNIKVAIGHTGASYDECLEASLDGATSFTHTYNGMRGLHHREPGVVGAALSLDNMYAELIGDGVHVHFVPAKILARAKGKDKLLLITDSVQVKGLPVGKYEKGLSTVEVKEDGCAYLPDGRLAGSSNKLIDEVRKLIEIAGVDEQIVINAATKNPATFLGVEDKKGQLLRGNDADIIVIDDNYRVLTTLKDNKIYNW